ncbi:pgl [Symbiodinium natans]|uniref:Pgl protein n=1 Tax=Symbiodinium natans TaxID=878477 RepID=A0A812SI41_9DINO|nr:pgl [Symbiodinium natans]
MAPVYIAGKTIIQAFDFDLETGALEAKAPPIEVDGAGSFLALGHAAGFTNNVLYSVAKPGAAAFRVDPATGGLAHLNTVKCDLSGACHVTVAYSGVEGMVITSAYGAGGLNVIRAKEDGSLAEVQPGASIQHHGGSNVYQPAEGNEQEQAHPHSCFMDPEGRFALVSDLGQDKIYTYAVDPPRGRLEARATTATAPGAGPRHLCFHPNGQLVYGINELDCTINVYSYDRDEGKLGLIQTVSTLPEGYNNRDHGNAKNAAGEPASGPNRPQQTNATADIHVSPDGRFVYGSNRGHDSLVCFAVGGSGQLELVGFTYTQGAHPRNFSIHPSGDWVLVANQDSDNVVVFRRDQGTGGLTATDARVTLKTARCILWGMPVEPRR